MCLRGEAGVSLCTDEVLLTRRVNRAVDVFDCSGVCSSEVGNSSSSSSSNTHLVNWCNEKKKKNR
jgi:hypothetical protein